jgi:prophage maintenance system killer protein
LKRPSLQLAVEINKRVRTSDEWFDEPDELDRVDAALRSISEISDPLDAAAVLAYRVTSSQGFTEGNKRTAVLLARWILDNNDLDGRSILDPDDRQLADLLVQAAAGEDVERSIIAFFRRRADSL